MARTTGRPDLPGTRRVEIGNATPQPLAIIAGLPAPVDQVAKVALQKEFPLWKIVTAPFPKTYEKTYVFDPALLNLLKAVCDFASSQPSRPVPRPGQLLLFYVDAPAFERILNSFGYSVLPVRLEVQDWEWPHGRHWRTMGPVVEETLIAAARTVQNDSLAGVKLRLERHANDEVLHLPPRNFRHSPEENLKARFDTLLRTGDFGAVDFGDIECNDFDHTNLHEFFTRVHSNAARFRVDSRGLVFARSLQGQHGGLWTVNLSSLPLDGFRYLLEGSFRFGTPLPKGFQHDVQWPEGRQLADERFFNAASGTDAPISGSHANVFPNDGVR